MESTIVDDTQGGRSAVNANATVTATDGNASEFIAALSLGGNTTANNHHCELSVASFDWESVADPYIIAAFLMISALIKIGFHHSGYLVTKVPESCILIILGTISGFIFRFAVEVPDSLKELQPTLFFLVLLPPIVLEASYSLHNRAFFENLGSVLVFAIFGTGLACFLIGPTLYVFYQWGLMGTLGDKLTMSQCLVYAALIVAVDPVAVLAIFQEVGVNDVLYFLVFGESLLNDAVTIVLYKTMDSVNCISDSGDQVGLITYVVAILKFVAVWIVGTLIGIFFGALTALVTRLTEEVRVVEPLALFMMAYLSYLTSELFHISGIISMTVCGLMQAQYAFHNISQKSYTTVKYFTKMAGAAADSIIFLYLGVNLVRSTHQFEVAFVLWCIFLCLIYRFVVIYALTLVLNRFFRLRQITGREQFIMAYGGLRGAVCFSLVSLLKSHLTDYLHNMFMTTTLALIIQTVFLQGATVKLLVHLLELGSKDGQPRLLMEELTINMIDHVLAGIEEVVGDHGRNVFQDWLWKIDYEYIKHWLQRNPMTKDQRIMKLYEKIVIKHHYEMMNNTKVAEQFAEREELPYEEEAVTNDPGPPSIGMVLPPTPPGSFAGSMFAEATPVIRPSVVATGSQRARGQSLLAALPQQTGRSDYRFASGLDDQMLLNPVSIQLEDIETRGSRPQVPAQPQRGFDASSVKDLRKLLSASKVYLSADKSARFDLISDDKGSDLVQQLQEKNKRMERLRRGLNGSMLNASLPGGIGTDPTLPSSLLNTRTANSLKNIAKIMMKPIQLASTNTDAQDITPAAGVPKGTTGSEDIDMRPRSYSEATVLKSRPKTMERAAVGTGQLETVKEGEDDGVSRMMRSKGTAVTVAGIMDTEARPSLKAQNAAQKGMVNAKASNHQIDKAPMPPVIGGSDTRGILKLPSTVKSKKLLAKEEIANVSEAPEEKSASTSPVQAKGEKTGGVRVVLTDPEPSPATKTADTTEVGEAVATIATTTSLSAYQSAMTAEAMAAGAADRSEEVCAANKRPDVQEDQGSQGSGRSRLGVGRRDRRATN